MSNMENTPLKGQYALQKPEDLLMRVDRVVPRWPALYRYSHGEKLYKLLDDMEALCVAANKKYFKKTTLQDLDIKNAQLQLLIFRLYQTAYTDKNGSEKRLITPGQHAEWKSLTIEIGKLIGGWMGSLSERGNAVKSSD